MSLLVPMMAYVRGILSVVPQTCVGICGLASTARRIQTQAASPQTQSSRPALVGRAPPLVFFVIEHGRRRLLHFTARHIQLASGSCSNSGRHCRFPAPIVTSLFDHDAKFDHDVFDFLASGIEPMRTSVRSPWQNGVAERWVGSVRRDLLDHVIPLNERHLCRLGLEYLAYYHEDCTHIGLDKTTPVRRPIELRPTETSRIESRSRIGSLHHRDYWAEAA